MIFLNTSISLVTRAQAAAAPCGRTRKPGVEQLVFHLRRAQDFERLRLQPVDVFGRRLRRRQQDAIDREDEVLVAGLLHGRHIRQIGPAAFGADREAAQRAGLNVRQCRRQRARTELHGAAEQRGNGVAAALEHDVRKFWQFLADLEQLQLQLRRRADRRRRAIVLLGIAAGERDEFLHGFRRQFRLDNERVRRCRKLAHCDEILVRIVGQLVVKPVIHRIGVGGEQDGVAIRFGMGGVFHADIAAGAAAIVDDEGLAGRLLERRRHHAGNDIGRAAGRIGDHELDGAVRISGVGRAHAQKCRRGDAGGEHARGFDNTAT